MGRFGEVENPEGEVDILAVANQPLHKLILDGRMQTLLGSLLQPQEEWKLNMGSRGLKNLAE